MECIEAQLEEIECLISIFPDKKYLLLSSDTQQILELYASNNLQLPLQSRLQYTFRFLECQMYQEIPELEIVYPLQYPYHDAIQFTICCPSLDTNLRSLLQCKLLEIVNHGKKMSCITAYELYQLMNDILLDKAEQEKLSLQLLNLHMKEQDNNDRINKIVFGRRAIYFHHIIAMKKRQVVKEWAKELKLSGFSKIGWPGIVIVEGLESDVQEYVSRLQHLRWKQMVVRGEQIENISIEAYTKNINNEIDKQRKFPLEFQELPEDGMSKLATLCQEAGLEELFLTTMKIYRSSVNASDDEQSKGGISGVVVKQKTKYNI